MFTPKNIQGALEELYDLCDPDYMVDMLVNYSEEFDDISPALLAKSFQKNAEMISEYRVLSSAGEGIDYQGKVLLNSRAVRLLSYVEDMSGDEKVRTIQSKELWLAEDMTFYVVSCIYTQLFNLLCEKADDVYGGRLPVHVRCLIDEMANIGQIPNLEKLVATIRSREISACLVLQAQSQLKAIYKDNADTIIGNMDSRIFLGGSEPTTLKELNQALGKETIDTYNTSNTRGNSPSYGLNYQKLGKDMPYLFVKSSVALNLS